MKNRNNHYACFFKTAIKRVFYDGHSREQSYLGRFEFDPHYIDGTEEFATNLFMSYFMSSFHNGYMINSLNIYTGPDPDDHTSHEVLQKYEWYAKYLSQKKLVTLYDDFFDLKKYKVFPLSEMNPIDIAAVTVARLNIDCVKGCLCYYFPKYDLMIRVNDDIGFSLFDVSNDKQKSHYFGLKFLKEAGKIKPFKTFINAPYQEEVSIID